MSPLTALKSAANKEDLLKKACAYLRDVMRYEDVVAFRSLPVRSTLLVIDPGVALVGIDSLAVTQADENQGELLKVQAIADVLRSRSPKQNWIGFSVADRTGPFSAGIIVSQKDLDSHAPKADFASLLEAFEIVWKLLSLKTDLKRVSRLDPDFGVLSKAGFSTQLDASLAHARENQSRVPVATLMIRLNQTLNRGRLLVCARVLVEALQRRVRVFDELGMSLGKDFLQVYLRLGSRQASASERSLAECIRDLMRELASLDAPVFRALSTEQIELKMKSSVFLFSAHPGSHTVLWDADQLMSKLEMECDLANDKEIRVVAALDQASVQVQTVERESALLP